MLSPSSVPSSPASPSPSPLLRQPELFTAILDRLPLNSLWSLRSVCKLFKSLVHKSVLLRFRFVCGLSWKDRSATDLRILFFLVRKIVGVDRSINLAETLRLDFLSVADLIGVRPRLLVGEIARLLVRMGLSRDEHVRFIGGAAPLRNNRYVDDLLEKVSNERGLEDEELPRTLAPSFYQDLPGLTKEQNASLKLAVQRYNAQAFLRLARHIFPQSDLFHSETLLSSLLLDLNPPKADLLPFVSAILASFRGNVRSRIALGLVRGLRAAGALSPRELFWTLEWGSEVDFAYLQQLSTDIHLHRPTWCPNATAAAQLVHATGGQNLTPALFLASHILSPASPPHACVAELTSLMSNPATSTDISLDPMHLLDTVLASLSHWTHSNHPPHLSWKRQLLTQLALLHSSTATSPLAMGSHSSLLRSVEYTVARVHDRSVRPPVVEDLLVVALGCGLGPRDVMELGGGGQIGRMLGGGAGGEVQFARSLAEFFARG